MQYTSIIASLTEDVFYLYCVLMESASNRNWLQQSYLDFPHHQSLQSDNVLCDFCGGKMDKGISKSRYVSNSICCFAQTLTGGINNKNQHSMENSTRNNDK